MTFGVYGFVAGIVKMDDLGLYMSRLPNGGATRRAQQAVGRALLAAAPGLMKTLAVVGTAAMFLVGGGILVHGLGPLHHAVQVLLDHFGTDGTVAGVARAVLPLCIDALAGVVAGALVFTGVGAAERLRSKKA
jgi:hypothetical protein